MSLVLVRPESRRRTPQRLKWSPDLAAHCRVLLHDRPKHRRLIRFAVLYPLYVLCEVAIISTDLAELLGSATGLCLLFPALPLWTGVLLTAVDVLVFLIVGDPSRSSRPVKAFELVMITLVRAQLAAATPSLKNFTSMSGFRRICIVCSAIGAGKT